MAISLDRFQRSYASVAAESSWSAVELISWRDIRAAAFTRDARTRLIETVPRVEHAIPEVLDQFDTLLAKLP
jgi:hypothetical protein